jgi:hypothetical protein
MSVTTPQTIRLPARSAAVGVLAAVAAATAIWAIAAAAGVDLTVRFGTGQPIEVTAVSVVVAALLAGLAGWGLLAVLRRFTARARAVWTGTATVAALLSLAGPLAATAPAATKVSLMAMHLTVAAVLIAVVRRTTRP